MRHNNLLAAFWRKLSGRGDAQPQQALRYGALPQRLSAQDTSNYIQASPVYPPALNYMTFWRGNQIPSAAIMDAALMRNIQVSSQDYQAPQRSGGNFNYNLGQLPSVTLIAQMRQAWIARSQALRS